MKILVLLPLQRRIGSWEQRTSTIMHTPFLISPPFFIATPPLHHPDRRYIETTIKDLPPPPTPAVRVDDSSYFSPKKTAKVSKFHDAQAKVHHKIRIFLHLKSACCDILDLYCHVLHHYDSSWSVLQPLETRAACPLLLLQCIHTTINVMYRMPLLSIFFFCI